MRSFVINPSHPGGQFARTIRVEGREPRLVKFTAGASVELDAEETAALADEIGRHIIGPIGNAFPEPPTPPRPKLYPGETPRDQNFDPIEESTFDLSGWQRCQRDLARRVNGTDRF